MPRSFYIITIALCIAIGWPKQAFAAEPSAPARSGMIFVVVGAGGFDMLGSGAEWAFTWAGVPHQVRHFVWTHGWGHLLEDLQDRPHLLRKADELAGQVLREMAANPNRPIFLLGKSAGTAIVLAAAERLPEASVERIILLSPAVSPRYDLRPSLRAVRREIVSFHSTGDRLFLDWGTSQFGTADRIYGPSAGLCGFEVPRPMTGEDAALYRRLIQVPWSSRMVLSGNLGTHIGTSLPTFLYLEVEPWVKVQHGDD